jgi:hypothetical protein
MILKKILFRFVSIVLTVFAITSGSSLADETAVNPELYGAWELMNLEKGGMRIQVALLIKDSEVISSNTCAFNEYSVLAEASSPAVITADEIQILESSSVMKEHSPGFLQCRASVSEGNLQYQLRNGKLVLTIPEKQETIELSRISP